VVSYGWISHRHLEEENQMKQDILWAIIVVIFTIVVFMTISNNSRAEDVHFGKVNVDAINTGNLQLKGITWCKKYFDRCVLKETWTGPIMNSRETVDAEQYVIMQMGITNPEIVEFADVGGGRYRIIFVYDQNMQHTPWIPQYKE